MNAARNDMDTIPTPMLDWTIWLRQQRRILVNVLSGIALMIGTLGLIFSIEAVLKRGSFSFNSIYYIASYILALILFSIRRIPETYRTYGLLYLIYMFGVFALVSG